MQSFLPEWAPNIHPMLVHFPIVLFIIAVFLDLVNLLWKKEWLHSSALAMFIMAALASMVT